MIFYGDFSACVHALIYICACTNAQKSYRGSECQGKVVGSSIALVAYQVIMIDDVSNGLLVYIAQAFLLVASIFGLDDYMKLINRQINGK